MTFKAVKFFSNECQLIDIEGMIELENHHISITNEITDSHKVFQ